jgi:hypothetical protein
MKRIKASVAFWALWYLSWAFVLAEFNPISWIQDQRFVFLFFGWGFNLALITFPLFDYETR